MDVPFRSFAAAPPPLTSLQRRVFWLTAALVAASRLLAVARTLWDWDEALFCLALREYDVTRHNPHPPGFPLYVLAAKGVSLVTGAELRAYQTVVVIAAMALFPLAFFVARELRFDFLTSYLGALLLVFFPTVWLYGGTAFSDIPGLAVLLAAILLLLRSTWRPSSYYAGAALLGCAAAFRPQALLLGCAPALLASWHQRRVSRVATASAIGGGIIAASYGGAALASYSVAGYFNTWAALRDYLRKVDSILNPDRMPLREVAYEVFVRPMRGGRLALVVTALMLLGIVISLVRRHAGAWVLVATFAPFAVFAWLMLDPLSVGRYATAILPMYAILAAFTVTSVAAATAPTRPEERREASGGRGHGPRTPLTGIASATQCRNLERSVAEAMPVDGSGPVARPPEAPGRSSGRVGAVAAATLVIGAIALRYAAWTLPALNDVRTHPSPTAASMRWIVGNVPKSSTVYFHGSMAPFAQVFIPDRPRMLVNDPREIPVIHAGDVYVTEGINSSAAEKFVREHGRVWDIVRQRYFETSIAPAGSVPEMRAGWWDCESDGAHGWCWMKGSGTVGLPGVAGPARLTLDLSPAIPHTTIEVALNGQVFDRFVAEERVQRSWTVTPRADARNELRLSVDHVRNPKREGLADDDRDLGLQLHAIEWSPAAP